jgi:hypothetical protein
MLLKATALEISKGLFLILLLFQGSFVWVLVKPARTVCQSGRNGANVVQNRSAVVGGLIFSRQPSRWKVVPSWFSRLIPNRQFNSNPPERSKP